MKHTIKIKKWNDVIEEYTAASANIRPGNLLVLNAAGNVDRHGDGTGQKAVLSMFALEDELQGRGIDDRYANGSPVQVWFPGRGDVVYALIADEEEIAIGDRLVPAAGGKLKKATPTESMSSDPHEQFEPVVGVAEEAVDLTTSTGAWGVTGRRICVRII